MKLIAVSVLAAISGILLFLLASASANTTLFARNYPMLLAANGVLTVTLAALVGYQIRKLWLERKAAQFGSQLKLRLVAMFAMMAIVPGVLIYSVSLQFAIKSIDSWFDVRVDTALESAIALGRGSLDYLLDQLEAKADTISQGLADGEALRPVRLNRLREQVGADAALIFTASGDIVATSNIDPTRLLPDLPSASQLRDLRKTHRLRQVESEEGGQLRLRIVVELPSLQLRADPYYLQLLGSVPEPFSHHASTVQDAYQDYQQLALGRAGLRQIYTLTLTLTLLLALFAAAAAAFVFARRLSAPLRLLAEGTQAVAQGDFSPRRALPARDELGVLTQSFSQMTRQLDDARGQAERNRAAVEASRAYLESVLANLSAGVLAFAADGTLRAANAGATGILGDRLEGCELITLAEWTHHKDFRDAILKGFAENEEDWHEQIEINAENGLQQTLLMHGSRLPHATDGGWVVVFDDISHLISAQRTAAWAEIARRVAHEIKNPLTPIQLSAERLEHRLSGQLDEAGKAMLSRSTRTIVNQVEAMKNLVNAFRDYAKLPAPELSPLDLNALVREVASLYEASPISLVAELDRDLPLVLGDQGQLRQVIHNLLQNAEDAVAEVAGGEVKVITRREGARAVLLVRDNGPGFAPEVLSRAIEPYFTTKTRGSGLGLAIVKKIIDEHGGDTRIGNRDSGGAEIRIRLRPAPQSV
ncbi:ATP-binding protein [Cognatazoarcus halotolerans]|uniref:ATP-binding protein n=1 Tax=Cognatazoarcus halotolerans TaxID=2686016 RepID=UPI0013572602|nr:ATP-binding protein [Cognatazoarcus halotolerans]MCP5310323.1 HAMP domain-containing protein [Zoogloeaceae bacterium]